MNVFLEPYQVLSKVYFEGAHLKIALGNLPQGEHGRTVKLCYAILEHDGYLELCVKSVAEKSPKPPIKLILKIALAGMLYADMPRPVSVNEAVGLAKLLGKGGAAGFVNACLRHFREENVHLPAGRAGLAVRSNFPRFAVDKICEAYGERAEHILLAKSHGVSVRFVHNFEKYAALPHEETPFSSVKIFKNFTRDEGFERGDYTFQSVGSVAICSVVEPCEKLLDACAAPGGKSVLLAERCKEVVACELHAHRAVLIERYAQRMHAANVAARCMDSTLFEPAFEGVFDGVLVDAPCSGLGTVSENPDLPLSKNEASMPALVALQRAILSNCSRYVKAGGHLYYSTCSILPEENDGAVQIFMNEHPDFISEQADCPLPHEKTAFGLQFLPDEAYGVGFYVAKLRKL